MGFCKIKDVEPEDVESLIYLCIPPERKDDRLFIDGNMKKVWASESLEKFKTSQNFHVILLDYLVGLDG